MQSKVIFVEMNFQIDSIKLDCNISILSNLDMNFGSSKQKFTLHSLLSIQLKTKWEEKTIFIWSRSNKSNNELVWALFVCYESVWCKNWFMQHFDYSLVAFLCISLCHFLVYHERKWFNFPRLSCHKSRSNHRYWLSIDM